jgi:hypothetical protein
MSDAPQAGREGRVYLLALLGIVIGLYAVGYVLLTDYYAAAIPHYDSVGGYIRAFEILNLAENSGYRPAVEYAARFHQSITQSFFAALFSPVLVKTPASFHLYNTLTTAVALAALFAFGRGAGMGGFGAACLALVFFLPDGLYWWSLGLFDYRRDPGFLGLLTGGYFLILAYLTGAWPARKRLWMGIASGAVMGLALISRDTGPPFVFGVAVLPALAIWLTLRKSLPLREWLSLPAGPLSGFLPFAAIYLWASAAMLSRIGDPLTMYGVGGDRMGSFFGNILSTLRLVTGYPAIRGSLVEPSPADLGLPYFTLTGILLAALAIIIAILWRAGQIETAARGPVNRAARVAALLGGIWIIAFVHLFLSLAVNWRAGQSFVVTVAPYYPSLIGVYSIAAGLALTARVKARAPLRAGLFIALGAVVLASMYGRADSRRPHYPDWIRPMHETVASLRSAGGGQAAIAELWHDDLKLPAVAFYAAQRRTLAPRRVFYQLDGKTYDFHIGTPKGEAARQALARAMERAARCQADYIVVSPTLAGYRQKGNPVFLYRYGGGFVEAILEDLKGRRVHIFGQDRTYPVAILDNRDRLACPDGR